MKNNRLHVCKHISDILFHFFRDMKLFLIPVFLSIFQTGTIFAKYILLLTLKIKQYEPVFRIDTER